jgi:hypothetical protein
MQLELRDLKPRIERLDRLARGLAREIRRQKGTLLLSRRQPLRRLRLANCWRILVFTRNPTVREGVSWPAQP